MGSSVYPGNLAKARRPCVENLDMVAYYDGSAAATPTIANGLLKLNGAKVSVHGQGVGYTGHLTSNLLQIPVVDILDGGAGVKVRSCLTRTKKKYRMKCCASTCNSYSDMVVLNIRPISTCEKFFEHDVLLPISLTTADVCNDDCCEKANNVAAHANRTTGVNDVVIVTAVQLSTEWYVEIEAVSEGIDFAVDSVEGFTTPELVVPRVPLPIMAKNIPSDQVAILGDCDADKCLPAIQIFFFQKIAVGGVNHTTSSFSHDTRAYQDQMRSVTVLFNPDDSDATTTRTALITALNNAGKMTTTTTEDIVYYYYCIVRTDAGDASALTTVASDYTGETSITRFAYAGGKSYYTYKGTSGTAPTPVSSDLVRTGACDLNDQPCPSGSPCS